MPEAHFYQGSIFEVAIPSCNIVSLIGEVVCYLFDNQSNEQTLRNLFQKIYDSLEPGGVLVFDFLSPEIEIDPFKRRRILETGEWSIFLAVDRDESKCILTRDIVLFRKKGEHYIRSQEIHQQRWYEPAVLLEILTNIGFVDAQLIHHYDQLVFRTGHLGIWAKK